jgi:hypothetical protein
MIKLDRPLKAGEAISATASVQNTGHTPANGCIFTTSITITRQTKMADFERALIEEKAVTVIGPGLGAEESVKTSGPIEDGNLAEINSKGVRIFVYGSVSYEIPGGRRGETSFCSVYDPERNAFVAYTEGNYAK